MTRLSNNLEHPPEPKADRPARLPIVKRLLSALSGPTVRLEASPLRMGPRGTYVFVHINKTGGTSVGRAIGLPVKQHLTARQIIERIGQASWDAAFRFSIVRNPWDKVVSHFNHRRRTNQTGLAQQSISFPDWVRVTYGPDKDLRYYDEPIMFLPQVEWLRDPQGRIDIDYVGKFEQLDATYQAIREQLGVGGELPHLNRTEPIDYRTFYDDATAELIGQWFAEDIARFDYQFDR